MPALGRALGRLADWLAGLVPDDLFDVDWWPVCGFLGCDNPVPGDYPWQMCENCYEMACEWDDSELGYT